MAMTENLSFVQDFKIYFSKMLSFLLIVLVLNWLLKITNSFYKTRPLIKFKIEDPEYWSIIWFPFKIRVLQINMLGHGNFKQNLCRNMSPYWLLTAVF